MVVDGYVRVSQVAGRSGEGFISPAVQREQIARWATLHGALLGRVFEEFDESGGRPDRPLLEEAITRVERGESEGLVVAYMSRFGRSSLHGLSAIDRITKAGGSFVSVQEGFDFSTDIGRHMLRTMLSWAEWELDRTRSNWETARARAVARGVYPTARPFGYRRQANGRLAVEPVEGPVVTDLFRRRAEGLSIAVLRESLVQAGVTTARGNANWRETVLCRLLQSRLYRGEVHYGGFSNHAAHEPLVSEETWQRAQRDLLDFVGPRPRRGTSRPLLRGILRCAGCRRAMSVHGARAGSSFERRSYHCKRLVNAGPCSAPTAVTDSVIEPYVEALFWQELANARSSPAAYELADLREALERRERELVAYRDNAAVPEVIGSKRFTNGLAVRMGRVERAKLELSRAGVRGHPIDLPSEDELRARWPTMSLDQRRAAIAAVIDCVFVFRGIGKIDERAFVCLRGGAPEDLPPVYPRKAFETRRFDPAACPSSPRLKPPPDWTEAQLRESLTRFLEGREGWPSFRDFQAAALAGLYEQVERHGGPRRWAALMGVPFVAARDGRPQRWSEERVRAELRGYLAGRASWPTRPEFSADGLDRLRRAVNWFGGPERWAREFGVELRPRQGTWAPWTYPRIKAELAAFTAGRADWPYADEFRAAGLSGLYDAISRHRVRRQLAEELGLEAPRSHLHRRSKWTDDTIKDRLDALLVGRSSWPTVREFSDAGLIGLEQVLRSRGIRDAWARSYGLKPPAGQGVPSKR